MALLLIAGCGYAMYTIWQTYFRYQAYGVITGRVIEVSPPWDGVLQYTHVHEGESVYQAQILATLDNVELRQRHSQLADELRVAQATLEAEVSKLKWQYIFNLDQGRGAVVNYIEAMASFLQEQARLEELQSGYERALTLANRRAISVEELERHRFGYKGQKEKVAKLKESLAALEKRAQQAAPLLKDGEESGQDQLKPFLAKIEALHGERERVQDRLAKCNLRAPVDGLVVKSHRLVGERCKPDQSVVSLLEQGSLEVVLYLPQGTGTPPEIGEQVQLVTEPYSEPLIGTVVRHGTQYEPAPANIKRHYSADQKLLPVYLQPHPESAQRMALRVGGVVKLPHALPSFWPDSKK